MYNLKLLLNILIYSFLLTVGTIVNAQKLTDAVAKASVSIEECHDWSRENFPLIRQMDIISKSTEYSLSNASIGNLPQISLNGQASYQSAVTQLPISIPNMEIPTIDKDQYKIYGEVYQPLTNFVTVNAAKAQIALMGAIEQQKLEVELYQLKDRINQLYFGVLLINEKIGQYNIILSDIDSTLDKVESAILNGTATQTDKSLLEVERISLRQQIDESKSNQKAFLKILSTFTGQTITANTILQKPSTGAYSVNINRPELILFMLQNQSTAIEERQLSNTMVPNIGLFMQAGYGRPALNFLSNEFDFYYIGGIKFNWNLSRLYNIKDSRKRIRLTTDKVAIQRETFLLNTKLVQTQQSAEIAKYELLIESDQEIIKMRDAILATAKAQLDNGLITTTDYVKFLNDVNSVKQNLLLHETQLHLSQYNLKTTTGN
jgi:outer membrane protein TolC